MSSSSPSLQRDGAVLLSPEVDDLLLHLRGLVLVRRILAERGATRAELDAHSAELARLRRRLGDIIGGEGLAQE